MGGVAENGEAGREWSVKALLDWLGKFRQARIVTDRHGSLRIGKVRQEWRGFEGEYVRGTARQARNGNGLIGKFGYGKAGL